MLCAFARFEITSMRLTLVDVQHSDGAAISGSAASGTDASFRQMSEGRYFVDNLAFTAPGVWDVVLTVQRGARSDILKLSVPVKLNPYQAARAAANATVVPSFALTDAYGRTITNATLRGKVWVADFFFASCPDVCPLMGQKLAALHRRFPSADFRTVSITTDPANDSPKILQALATRYGAERERWYFLTGDKEAIVALSENGLKLGVASTTASHSSRLVVVDREGRIRGTFDSARVDELEQLAILVGQLLGTAAH